MKTNNEYFISFQKISIIRLYLRKWLNHILSQISGQDVNQNKAEDAEMETIKSKASVVGVESVLIWLRG